MKNWCEQQHFQKKSSSSYPWTLSHESVLSTLLYICIIVSVLLEELANNQAELIYTNECVECVS